MSKENTQKKKYYPHGKNRIVYLDECGHIVYEYLTCNMIAFCNNNPILYEILNSEGLSPFKDNSGGIRFKLQSKKSVIKKCKLSLLCHACYDGHITSVDHWQEQYKKYRRWMNNFKYQVDHADGNQLNCTEYNLSVMSGHQNAQKSEITARIKQPVLFYCGHYGESYRIRVFYPIRCKRTNDVGITLKLKCSSASDFISCIREIEELECGYGKPSLFFNESGELEKVKSGTWKKNRRCVSRENIALSMKEQSLIAWMFDCEFVPYAAGQVRQLFLKERDGISEN